MTHSNPYAKVKHMIDDIPEILYQERFTTQDLEGTQDERQHKAMKLHGCGAVKKVDSKRKKTDQSGRKRYINVYEWDSKVLGKLQNYKENRDELPCGCTPHVPPNTTENGLYPCKHCGDKHDPETIRNAL